jgi:hypothetical protein
LHDLGIKVKEVTKFDPHLDSIVIIDSLNTKGRKHCVYWDSTQEEAYDPQTNRMWGEVDIKCHTTETFLKAKKLATFQKN